MGVTTFRVGDYRSAEQAQHDAVSRLDAFSETTKIAAKNAVSELISLQGGTITCHQVAVISQGIADAVRGQTRGQHL